MPLKTVCWERDCSRRWRDHGVRVSSQHIPAEYAKLTDSLANQIKSNALFWSTIWSSRTVFLLGMLSRICLMAFKYAQPFLIQRTIGFASNLGEDKAIGWGLTGAWCCVFIGLAVCISPVFLVVSRLTFSRSPTHSIGI
jgi:hypothetical protein